MYNKPSQREWESRTLLRTTEEEEGRWLFPPSLQRETGVARVQPHLRSNTTSEKGVSITAIANSRGDGSTAYATSSNNDLRVDGLVQLHEALLEH